MPAPEVTYDFYAEAYSADGRGMDEVSFLGALPQATARVKSRCVARGFAGLTEEELTAYKRAVCAAAELIDSPQAASWSAGKASKSYCAADSEAMTVDAAIEREISGTALACTWV